MGDFDIVCSFLMNVWVLVMGIRELWWLCRMKNGGVLVCIWWIGEVLMKMLWCVLNFCFIMNVLSNLMNF